MENKIKFVVKAVEWFDKVNGNSYYSFRVLRTSDGAELKSEPMTSGYGDAYRYDALKLMLANNWLPKKYKKEGYKLLMYDRENNYPIDYSITNGLKKEMINFVA